LSTPHCSINIIDQQAGFIVVNKPAGIGFHNEEEQTGFFQQVKSALSLTELYPVHRLDKMTSGLLVLATNKQTAQAFQMLFQHKLIEKYYLAISDKKPSKKQGLLIGDMEKSRRGMWKLLRTRINPAISQFFSYSLGDGKRLFVVKPHTGKTHQIRVALASLGASILGDEYYSKSSSDRGYLHAYGLRFTLHDYEYQYVYAPDHGVVFTQETTGAMVNSITPPWKLPWPNIKK